MNEQLFIPEKIKVGYQERNDTYTKKLGYVIYYDNKGVLRKEKSWRGWIDKGHDGRVWQNGGYITDPEKIRGPLDTDDFSNEPMEGFVINRGGGGVKESWGWNTRHEFVRVFDPRGFEFEISIANLLYILQESNSIKGKGLEGEFVYAWAGPTLCLLPVNSAEYKKCQVYTKLQDEKVGAKELTPGCIYLTKKQQRLVYMGRFNWHTVKRDYNRGSDTQYLHQVKKQHIFVTEDKNMATNSMSIQVLASLTSLGSKITTDPVDEYATMMDILNQNRHMSKPVGLQTKSADLTMEKQHHNSDIMQFKGSQSLYIQEGDVYISYHIGTETEYNHTSQKSQLKGYTCEKYNRVGFNDKSHPFREHIYRNNRGYFDKPKLYTEEQIKAMKFVSLFVELESGALIPFNSYI